MGLYADVNYYYLPDDVYTQLTNMSPADLEEGGYSITAGQLESLIADFGPNINGYHYAGEDKIDEDEAWFLIELGYGDTWMAGSSGELITGMQP